MPENQTIAFLDIETTGLSPQGSELTVVGIYKCNHTCPYRRAQSEIHQLVGTDITAVTIRRILEGVDTVYTYNGSRFDLPFIKAKLMLDIPGAWRHINLMYACWKKKLYGGLKSVERQCGIGRTTSINGLDAVY